MTLDNEQIVRKAYQIAEDQDLEGWVAAFTDDGTFTDESIGVTFRASGAVAVVGDLQGEQPLPPVERDGWVWPVAGADRVKRAALSGLAQSLLGVFGQEIAERDAAAPGLGREPPGQVTRKHDGAAHAVVALPAFVTQFRHVPSFVVPELQRGWP